jgi:cell division protein FtsI/penicillin-binding protein 2
MTRYLAVGLAAAVIGVAALLSAASPSENTRADVGKLEAADAGVSYLLLDARSGISLQSRWQGMNQVVPLGSLVKPFTALAYAQTHRYHYPEFECRGESAGCWWPAGHGRIKIETAISHSCNLYFRLLAEQVDPSALSAVAWRFGIAAPGPNAPNTSYVGLGDRWRAAPLAMARAYRELVLREAEPGVAPLLVGMKDSAASGTGRGVGAGVRGGAAWAKTGTAPCVHQPASNGDGYAVAVYPAPGPKYVLLVQKHGVPGRLAAVAAGEMLADLTGAR